MIITTLNNLVCKTASVGFTKLTTSANRIGTGLPMVIGTHSATFLSPGYIPVPRLPDPEQVSGSRQEVTVMPLVTMNSTGIPTSWVGSFSGTSACHHPLRMNPRTPPTAVRSAGASRTSYPGSPDRSYQLSRDCQSSDRRLDSKDQTANRLPAAWQRTATPAAEAKK